MYAVGCIVGFLVLAWGLGAVAWKIHLKYDGKYADELIYFLLQLGVVGVGTALVGLLVTGLTYFQTKVEEKTDQRLDLLRRIRAAHVRIVHAKRILKSDESAKIYTQQMRKLMLVIPELEDIGADVVAAKRLFGKDNGQIKGGVDDLVTYLEKGYTEYTDHLTRPQPRTTRPVGGWLTELVDSEEMPCCYDEAVGKSKGCMRFHVYGSMDRKDNFNRLPIADGSDLKPEGKP
jgi:hypothetical protein